MSIHSGGKSAPGVECKKKTAERDAQRGARDITDVHQLPGVKKHDDILGVQIGDGSSG